MSSESSNQPPMNVLITGCSRGIGWGLVRQFLEKTNARVIATCRHPEHASLLHDLQKRYEQEQSRLLICPLDISHDRSIQDLYNQLPSMGVNTIDMLICNAGISNRNHPSDPVLTASTEDMMSVFRTNVVGNLRLLQTFHPMLANSSIKIALLMSSSRGSFTNAAEIGEQTSYRVSKAGLNMIGVLYASDPEVREAGIKVIMMHPGWVKTDMGLVGGQPANVDIETSTDGILEILERTAVLQLQKFSNDEDFSHQYRFSGPVEEIEKKEYLNPAIERLYENNFVFVKYDGDIMDW